MPTTYNIKFNNDTEVDNTYAFFVAAPVLSSSPADGFFTNVWISRYVPSGSWFDFSTTDQFYAWTGTAPQQIAPGVVVSGGDGKPADLALDGAPGSEFLMTVVQDVPALGPDTKDDTFASSFGIKTTDTFNVGDNDLVGMGQLDNNNQVVAVATVAAQPQMSYQFTPIVTYYVAETQAVQGTTMDVNAGSISPAKIDFSSGAGLDKSTANVSVDKNNSWTITYA